MTKALARTSQPARDRLIALAIRSLTVQTTKDVYISVLGTFLNWAEAQGRMLDRQTVLDYRDSLIASGKSSSSVNLALSSIRALAREAKYEGALPPAVIDGIIDVKGIKSKGKKTGTWLSIQAAELLLDTPNARTLKGKRDRAVLALLVGCGLRRAEVTGMKHEQIQQRDGRWVVVDLLGKGSKFRTVPVPSWVKECIDRWWSALIETLTMNTTRNALVEGVGGGIEGFELPNVPLILAIRKGDHLDLPLHGVDDNMIWYMLQGYCEALARSKVAPHDLRRTFGKLAHKGGSPIEQISLSLGHNDIKTTQIYLNIDQDLTSAPCDVLGIKPKFREGE